MSDLISVNNYIGGQFVPPSTGKYMTVENPADMSEIGKVALSSGTRSIHSMCSVQISVSSTDSIATIS
jgi:acyl-CoA reductase-like NAD-dependent aldehyde dehydrogenase